VPEQRSRLSTRIDAAVSMRYCLMRAPARAEYRKADQGRASSRAWRSRAWRNTD